MDKGSNKYDYPSVMDSYFEPQGIFGSKVRVCLLRHSLFMCLLCKLSVTYDQYNSRDSQDYITLCVQSVQTIFLVFPKMCDSNRF